MPKIIVRSLARKRRHYRGRKKIVGTPDRPRLSVFRSEKNILAQLQKENAFNPDQSSDKKDGDFGQKDEREGIKDLKGELQDNQLHQAAGQTHGTFKAHVAAAALGVGQEQSLGSKLEENREANINEIMTNTFNCINTEHNFCKQLETKQSIKYFL